MRFGRHGIAAGVLAVAAATGLAACGGGSGGSGNNGGGTSSSQYPGAFGSIPAQHGTPKSGGTVSYALPPGATPNWIFPVYTAAGNSVYNVLQFFDQMWRPLYWTTNGVEPVVVDSMSPADAPVWSNGDKTVSITLKSTYKWPDGKPLSAQDLLFSIDLIKQAIKESPANWAPYTPGQFPDDLVSATAKNSSTVVLTLKSAVNPEWFEEDYLGAVYPLPAAQWAKASANGPILNFTNPTNLAKIYNFLLAQAKSVSTFATNPLWQVVDGPWKLSSYNSSTGAFTMVRNTAYGGPAPGKMSVFKGVPFTSDSAEFNALKAGTLDVGYLPLDDVPQAPVLKRSGYDLFGYPQFGWDGIMYNFKDSTGDFGNIAKQLYFRQAMMHLEDEQGYIKAFFHGAGSPGYGPVPKIPRSPFTPADATTDPYPFSVSAAKKLLSGHGWAIHPNGADVCTKPGTGSNECGAGIPAGTKLAFTLIYSTSPNIIGEQVTALASEAKQVGIQLSLKSSNFNYMISNYNDPAAPANINKWAMEDFGGYTNSTYPTTQGLFNCTGTINAGGYCDPKADQLINASITSPDVNAVKQEASYLTMQQPALFQPTADIVAVWKNSISGPSAYFANLTQYPVNPEFWSFVK